MNLLYTHSKLSGCFSDISVTVTYSSGYGIYEADGYVTFTEMSLKVLSGHIAGLRFMSSYDIFRPDIFPVYTCYIPGIYQLRKEYTRYIPYI